jgi:hypothetical protein
VFIGIGVLVRGASIIVAGAIIQQARESLVISLAELVGLAELVDLGQRS